MTAEPPNSDIAFTPTVKSLQERLGSRKQYLHVERQGGWARTISEELARFIAERDSFYLATANLDAQPYIQHRGGPVGLLKVLDAHTLAFADFSGNRQYITTGNLLDNARAFLFLMDYANRRRIKIWGTAEVIENDATLLERVRHPEYHAEVDRVIRLRVHAWESNCTKHIPRKLSESEVMAIVGGLHARVEQLEAENRRLRERHPDD